MGIANCERMEDGDELKMLHVDRFEVGPLEDQNDENQCPACGKTFKRFYRNRYPCTDCGRPFCSKCIDKYSDARKCKECGVKVKLDSFVAWASQGYSVPFDMDTSVKALIRMC